MKYTFLIFFLSIYQCSFAQYTLGQERVNHLKKSTVRIIVDNNPVGSGFFISDKGEVLTCFHVVFNETLKVENNKIVSRIQIETNSGKRTDAIIPDHYRHKGIENARLYDYCLLKIPVDEVESRESYLRLGSFSEVKEGDWVISSGYPQKIPTPFISGGLLSTKWVDTVKILNNNDTVIKKRDVAWLDLTLNPGNSGGPIVLLGESIEKDKVIGIASFILNPFARNAIFLKGHALKVRDNIKMSYGGINQIDINALLADAIANNSIGVSGCVSIDYFKETR